MNGIVLGPCEASGPPLVSVCCITYNHERYIAQAIEGFLMQKTNFPYEVVIGEDCSTDTTRETVYEYAAKHPQAIRVVTSERNVGARSNGIRTRSAARGRYVALCEGDDYWTNPLKLQKQVDFLQKHPECTVCFHNAEMIYEDQRQESHNYCPSGQKQISGLEDLLRLDFIPTCSVMYRRGVVPELPDWFHLAPTGDWPLLLLHAEKGKIGYIDEVMGVRRVHSTGAWCSLTRTEMEHKNIKFYHYANAHLGFRHERLIKTCLSDCYRSLATAYARDGDMAKARMYARRSLTERPLGWSHLDPRPYREILRSHIPRTYQLIKKVATKAGLLPEPES